MPEKITINITDTEEYKEYAINSFILGERHPVTLCCVSLIKDKLVREAIENIAKASHSKQP